MDKKKLLIVLFVMVALVQLYLPANLIWEREDLLKTGVEYKFKTAPVDPNDPFRGKFITLSFDINPISVLDEKDWDYYDQIYLSFEADDDGFSVVKTVSKTEPPESTDYLQTEISFVSGNGSNEIDVELPFTRYYMEESKAQDAEDLYFEVQLDSTQLTYAIVAIKNGKAGLKDVMIDGVSIKTLVEK